MKQLCIRDIYVKFGIPNLSQSLDIGHSSDEGISNFRIFDQISYKQRLSELQNQK